MNSYTDPFGESALITMIKSDYLQPLKEDLIQRPENKNSLILYGESGARKTYLVEKIGETLNWPILTLTASNFLRGELKEFDTTSTKIFEDLLRFRRVIVHFTKCEEFFRYAETGHRSIDNRTEGAFIIPNILHHLQSLHNMKWVIFILETNMDTTKIDPAITSNMIFDNSQEISFPRCEVQVQYVRRIMGNSAVTFV